MGVSPAVQYGRSPAARPIYAHGVPRASDRPLPAHAAETIVSRRRSQTLDERRRALARLFLIGCYAWPAFAIVDVLGTRLAHREHAILLLLTLRAVGIAVALGAYFVVTRARLTSAMLTAIDYAALLLAGTFVSVMGAAVGGLESRFYAGVIVIVAARATLVPSRWSRSAGVAAAIGATWPATLAAAALVLPEVRAQWASSEAVLELLFGTFFIAGMVVIGATGSHMLWSAGRQVHEARRLGNYRLKTRIGGGGNGDVWLARQDPLGRDVALKILKDRGLRGEESVRRFEREARAAAALKHPNTIRIIEFGASDDGVLFIAMELLDGMDLDQLVELSGRLPPARAIHLARQACASLAEAHAAGIVHRDIKPANLFVTRVGDDYDFLKLLDFGVARVIDADRAPLTEAGLLFGTPEYMSPEMCSGERADARSDVYSLGAVLYFMLTGTPLFPGRGFAETVMSHISRETEPPSVRAGVPLPDPLEAAIMRCLEKKPDDRFFSVRELDEALAACERAGQWSKDDARAFWVGSKPSLPLRARGAI
jgi:hypothetical protein